jgi:glucose-1-phosphate adenylyltransferase
VRNSVIMGADFYEAAMPPQEGLPALGIGRNCVIERAIIDKNARIGDGVVITPEGKSEDADGPNWYVRDGIVIIPKNAVIPAGGWI